MLAVTAAPLGMGAALLNFLPGGMSFEQYFRIKGLPQEEQALRFLVGLAPALLHRTYLVDPSRVDLRERRGPSTVMACQLCAGMAATEVLKILLPSPIRYIGLLGPRRRAGELLAELEKQSLSPTPEQAQRLYAPVGLDLGAEGPEGVALSVLAEIQAVVASRAPGHLRERKGSIHGLTTASPTATPAATRV